MSSKLVPAWQGTIVDAIVRALPFAYGLLWGAFLAMCMGAIDGGGDTLKLAIALLTGLTGAGLGLLGSRSLHDRTAERERFRRLRSELLKVMILRRTLTSLCRYVGMFKALPGDDPAAKRQSITDKMILPNIGTAAATLCHIAEDPPDWADLIDDDADLRHALAAKRIFAWVAARNDKLVVKDGNYNARLAWLTRFLGSFQRARDATKACEDHFRSRLPKQ